MHSFIISFSLSLSSPLSLCFGWNAIQFKNIQKKQTIIKNIIAFNLTHARSTATCTHPFIPAFHCFCRRFVNSANGLDLFLWYNVSRFAREKTYSLHMCGPVDAWWWWCCCCWSRWIDAWHLFVKFEATAGKLSSVNPYQLFYFIGYFFVIKFAPHSRRLLPPHT